MNDVASILRTSEHDLGDLQIAQFVRYATELQRWNEQVNLTAITDSKGIAVRHFLDSLRVALFWRDLPARLIDIGTGAGFPGIPLKIAYPTIAVTLVESIEKKAAFLRHIVAELGLTNVEVVVARAETVGRDPSHREHYDLVTARAVADLRVLAEYCLPLCRVGGRFIAPKGGQSAQEVEQAQAAIIKLGGRLVGVEPIELPGVEPRTLVVVDKVAPTPEQYPRSLGVPAKRPL